MRPASEILAIYNEGGNRACATPHISISPASPYNSNSVNVGSSATQAFTISNTGTAVLSLSSIALTGDSDYTVDPTAGANPCGTIYPKVLAQNTSCTATVSFHPASQGRKTGTLTVNSDGEVITELRQAMVCRRRIGSNG